ncbi:hypothetical protein PHYPSEUDO_012192 [Phytophthora pseudosyringae]|uniref:Methyltransferase type 12 domain-containing protein n=1 Tax=Phytophthora pseudosyringae TaxID=221518 RepID=A0A8T1W588_9STRA|nr:hypothetical protein PHYPSEUDO_012192 [Phytophthora pseudosyringae]
MEPNEVSPRSPQFVSVATPLGTKQMTLAPFGGEAPSSPTVRQNQRQKTPSKKTKKTTKRKADDVSSSSSSSSQGLAAPPADATWARNLQRRGGFWGDAHWYDLQLERRMPLAKPMLRELVLALPPCGGHTVLDLCAGSGRASAAVLEAYPTAALVLVDASEQRLAMAGQRLDAAQSGASERAQLVVRAVSETTQLWDEPVDVVVACLAFHVLVERPAHYSHAGEQQHQETTSAEDTYEQLFRATWRALRPGGHVVLADHVGQLALFKQLKALESAGFQDVDCAWRQEDSFVAGGRKPLA